MSEQFLTAFRDLSYKSRGINESALKGDRTAGCYTGKKKGICSDYMRTSGQLPVGNYSNFNTNKSNPIYLEGRPFKEPHTEC